MPTCSTCGIAPPLRAHHCHACRCCVRTFDHHCFWIGTCVGERNHFLFAAYLYVQSAVLLLALSSIGDALQHDDYPAVRWSKIAVLICLLSALVMVGALAVFHTYLLCTGQTTREVAAGVIRRAAIIASPCPAGASAAIMQLSRGCAPRRVPIQKANCRFALRFFDGSRTFMSSSEIGFSRYC